MKQHGVHTGDYHYRNDKYTIFGGKKKLPTMDRLESQYLLLPLHHGVSERDVERICSLLKQFSVSQLTSEPRQEHMNILVTGGAGYQIQCGP